MKLGPLTERESEIVLLLADGHRGTSAAQQLGISYETIRRHINNIMNKLGTNSANDVISWYYKKYWMPKVQP